MKNTCFFLIYFLPGLLHGKSAALSASSAFPVPYHKFPITDTAFIHAREVKILKQALKKLPSDESRISLIRSNLLKKKYFTRQLKKILPAIATEYKRLELAKEAYLKVADKQDYRSLLKLFKEKNNREELNRFIMVTH